MKYIFRILWLIGYIPVFVFILICFTIMLFTYPFVVAFYFIKTGNCNNITFTPDVTPIIIDNTYKKLLKYIR